MIYDTWNLKELAFVKDYKNTDGSIIGGKKGTQKEKRER